MQSSLFQIVPTKLMIQILGYGGLVEAMFPAMKELLVPGFKDC